MVHRVKPACFLEVRFWVGHRVLGSSEEEAQKNAGVTRTPMVALACSARR